MKTLREIRESKGIRLREAAAACAIWEGHMRRIEQGKMVPSVSMAARVAAALGLSLDEFNDAFNEARAQAAASPLPPPAASTAASAISEAA